MSIESPQQPTDLPPWEQWSLEEGADNHDSGLADLASGYADSDSSLGDFTLPDISVNDEKRRAIAKYGRGNQKQDHGTRGVVNPWIKNQNWPTEGAPRRVLSANPTTLDPEDGLASSDDDQDLRTYWEGVLKNGGLVDPDSDQEGGAGLGDNSPEELPPGSVLPPMPEEARRRVWEQEDIARLAHEVAGPNLGFREEVQGILVDRRRTRPGRDYYDPASEEELTDWYPGIHVADRP